MLELFKDEGEGDEEKDKRDGHLVVALVNVVATAMTPVVPVVAVAAVAAVVAMVVMATVVAMVRASLLLLVASRVSLVGCAVGRVRVTLREVVGGVHGRRLVGHDVEICVRALLHVLVLVVHPARALLLEREGPASRWLVVREGRINTVVEVLAPVPGPVLGTVLQLCVQGAHMRLSRRPARRPERCPGAQTQQHKQGCHLRTFCATNAEFWNRKTTMASSTPRAR